MAISVTQLLAESSNANQSNYTTTSVAPTDTRMAFLAVFSTAQTAANFGPPSSVTGNSLTWTQDYTTGDAASGLNLSVFRAYVTGSSSGTIAINHATSRSRCTWMLLEVDGADTGGTNGANSVVQIATNSDLSSTAATITVTLAAFGNAANGAVAFHAGLLASASVPTATAGSGWTEVGSEAAISNDGGVSGGLEAQYRTDNDTTADVTWSANLGMYSIAMEIKAAGGATYTPRSMLLGVG